MSPAVIALGGNVGNTEELFDFAIETLGQTPGISSVNRSGVYETAPIGTRAGARFRNAAACVETSLTPENLLKRCLQIEQEAGRKREFFWGPRTLDLDLITQGQTVRESEFLTLPHPACWYRRFVLDPVVEIAGSLMHPIFQRTFEELRARLLRRPLTIDLSGLAEQRRQRLIALLTDRFSSGQLKLSIQSDSQNPTWILQPGRLESYHDLNFPELYEQQLPGTFEEYLPAVIAAALDGPQRP